MFWFFFSYELISGLSITNIKAYCIICHQSITYKDTPLFIHLSSQITVTDAHCNKSKMICFRFSTRSTQKIFNGSVLFTSASSIYHNPTNTIIILQYILLSLSRQHSVQTREKRVSIHLYQLSKASLLVVHARKPSALYVSHSPTRLSWATQEEGVPLKLSNKYTFIYFFFLRISTLLITCKAVLIISTLIYK